MESNNTHDDVSEVSDVAKKSEGRDWKKDSRSIEELFTASLEGDYDDDAPWDAIGVLRMRATAEIFELAKRQCKSDNPKARARALDVVSQLGTGKPDSERPWLSESVAIAVQGTKDTNAAVVHSAAWALAHLGGEKALSTLIAMKNHPDYEVRHAVALGLHGVEQPWAIQILIELMDDANGEVRDWATFGLGQGSPPLDSPEIRAALRKRLDDPYEEARAEAIWGWQYGRMLWG